MIYKASIVNEVEVDVFLELSCFFYDPTNGGNLISGSSVISKSSLNIWKFSVHVLLKPSLENFEYYFASMWISGTGEHGGLQSLGSHRVGYNWSDLAAAAAWDQMPQS